MTLGNMRQLGFRHGARTKEFLEVTRLIKRLVKSDG